MQLLQNIWKRDPAWISVWISIVISIWIIFTDDLINSDGVVYIEVAAKIADGEWLASIKQYSWPFYSILIALVSKISFMGLETSAYVINILFQALLAFVFVRCAQLMGGSNKVALFAAILLLTNVTLNGYRDQIIRDFGYWAFFFTALYFFLQYHQSRLIKYAIGFGISILVATLFRIEGIVFLFLVPLLIVWNEKNKESIYSTALLLSPVLVIFLLGSAYVAITEVTLVSIGRLGDPLSYIQHAYHGLVSGIVESGDLLEKHVLSVHAQEMGTRSMLAILVMMFIVKIISASGYISLFFSATTYLSKEIKNTIVDLNIINGFMIINAMVLTVFLLSNNFLTPRYTMTMGLLISLPAAFGLAHFMESNFDASKWKQRAKIFLIVIFVYMFLDGLISFSASKTYIKESGAWLKENMPEDARLIANERMLYYYAGKELDTEALTAGVAMGVGDVKYSVDKVAYDYLAIKLRKKREQYKDDLIRWSGTEPVFSTSNERGDTVFIFKLNTKN